MIEKVWGTTETLIRTPMFEMHRLHVKPWMRCSWHVHQFKHNAFYILDGILFIDAARGAPMRSAGERPVTVSGLAAGETYTIDPGTYHQFRTGQSDCVCLECYYTEPLSEDIIRRNVGGPA